MVSLQNENSFRFLRVAYDNSIYGKNKASTRAIRDEADLSRGETHHQYETLEEKGLIEVERDMDATPEGQPAMKIAVLTDLALEEIDKGLLVEAEEKYGRDEPEGVEEIAEEVSSLQESVSDLESLAGEVESLKSDLEDVESMVDWTGAGSASGAGVEEERVETVEGEVSELQSMMQERVLASLKMLHVSVARIELALEEEGIDVSSVDVPDEKEQEMVSRVGKYRG